MASSNGRRTTKRDFCSPNLALFVTAAFFLLGATAANDNDTGTNNFANGRFKVYQIRPTRVEQLAELNRMEQMGMIDFWRPPPGVNATGDVMIDAALNGHHFLDFLRTFQVEARVLVDDLTKLIEEKEIGPSERIKLLSKTHKIDADADPLGFFGFALRDDAAPDARFDSFGAPMGDYHSYADLQALMARVHAALPGRTLLRNIGWTVEGRPIQGIQFGNPSDRNRPIVWIDAGIHAREWTAVHTAAYFIFYIANQLRLGLDQRLLHALDHLDVLIFPCLNPDGYEYSRSEPRNPAVRMWRKNRGRERCADSQRDQQRYCCKGVDLNRNFDFKFAGGGTSFFPCSEIFHGAGAFSEPESQAVRDAILGPELRGRVPAMITMHAYSQLWIYPFSNRRGSYPADVEDLKAVARRAVSAIADKFGTHYQYGTGPEIIYAYTGGSADWAKETVRIKYTYTLELRPSYWSWNGFVLDRAQLVPTARETFDGVMVVLEQVLRDTEQQQRGVVAPPNGAHSPPFVRRSIIASSGSNDDDKPPVVSKIRRPPSSASLPCEDAQPHCTEWLRLNGRICQESRATMAHECRATCAFC